MNKQVTSTEFTVVDAPEPHKQRRRDILAKHPEIKECFGPDLRLLPSILAIMASQLSICIYATQIEMWKYFLLAYSVGGTLTHWLSLGNHELAHNLCFRTTAFNEALGLFANCAQGLPSFVTFKKYHLEHHYHQGNEEIDVDLPTEWEGRFFNTTLRKILWVILQPFFYAIRPLIVRPKEPGLLEFFNFATTIGFDLVLWYFYGPKAPLFNIVSTLLGMGLHPVAGHFIAEHYTFAPGQETYSYYGWLNLVAFNVGYHNEHHDFPRVSGFSLPRVKALAPEFYENLHSYDSWIYVIYDYIVREDIGPFSRVKRAA